MIHIVAGMFADGRCTASVSWGPGDRNAATVQPSEAQIYAALEILIGWPSVRRTYAVSHCRPRRVTRPAAGPGRHQTRT